MTDDDLQKRLGALGKSPAPTADPVFADRLEADLRVMAAEPLRPRPVTQLLRPSVVVVALALVAGAAFFVSRPERNALEFASVEGTSVSIPGAASLASGATGQPIPDGTRITVGPNGSATLGGVILDPGTVAVVVNGVVEVIELPPNSPAPSTTEPASAAERTTTNPPSSSAPSTTDPTVQDSTSVAPSTTTSANSDATTTTTTQPATTTTAAPTTSLPPSTTAPTTTATPTTAAPREAAAPTITLTMTVGENGRAVLGWTVDGDDDEIAGWVVRRGRGDDSTIVAVIRRPEARRQRVDLPDRNVGWTVVARDANGDVIARSNVVRAN